MKRLGILVFVAALATVATVQLWPAALDIRTEDHNGDGRADVWRHYDSRGRLTEVAVDTNFDGHADVQEYFEGGVLVRRESDRNLDDQVDLVERFDAATHQQLSSVVDVDYDGGADLLVLFRDGRPVFMEQARALAVNLRQGSGSIAHGSGPGYRAVGNTPLPLTDPFRDETALRATQIASGSAPDGVGLSTSGGLPSADLGLVSPITLSSSLSSRDIQHPVAVSILPRSPRGPPLS